ncbi:hypothetical protein [Streptosporangium sp. NPDC049078]|uniref:hypothetical protein n=1 Tax=Streptosporangium sp. NPDC049078 TaxID=3155767 RepID=UPI00342E77B1
MTATAVDTAQATTRWTVHRWDADQTAWVQRKSGLLSPTAEDFARLGVEPYKVSEVLGNLVTNAGWTRLMSLLTNQGGTQAMTATHTRIGVGDSNTTETYTDTALNAVTNKLYKLVTGAGTLGTRSLSFATTFGPSEANWAWNEFGMDIGATADSTTVAACFWNHKAGIAQGTKANGQTWAASAAVTFS